MRYLEEIIERVADHRSPVAVGGVKRCFHAGRSGRERALIRAVRVVDVDVKESWERLAIIGGAHHDQRIADAHLGWATSVDFTNSSERRAQEVNGGRGVADDHAG